VRRPGRGRGRQAARTAWRDHRGQRHRVHLQKALGDWAWRRGVKLDYTRPGKPTDNGLIESFNGRLRDEFPSVNEFVTMADVRQKLKAWQDDYNHHRPHGSLGHLTPSEFATMRSGQPKEAARL